MSFSMTQSADDLDLMLSRMQKVTFLSPLFFHSQQRGARAKRARTVQHQNQQQHQQQRLAAQTVYYFSKRVFDVTFPLPVKPLWG